jgi:hypothetical protein
MGVDTAEHRHMSRQHTTAAALLKVRGGSELPIADPRTQICASLNITYTSKDV